MTTVNPAQLIHDIDEALRVNDMKRALDLAATAILNDIETPKILNLTAYGFELRGDYFNALRYLRRALAIAPNDPSILFALGSCLSKEGQFPSALNAFDRAIALAPNYAPPHCGRGHALGSQGDRVGAGLAYDRAIALEPGYAEALAGKAAILLREKRLDEARLMAEKALAIESLEPRALIVMARVARENNDMAGAEKYLRAAMTQAPLLDRALTLRTLADILHETERFDEAMAAYQEANRTVRRVYAAEIAAKGVESARHACARLSAYFETAKPEDWRGAPGAISANGTKQHVFLLGFPRSGTTLLEQVLASHPDIVALEESPNLEEPLQRYLVDNAGLTSLRALNADAAQQERAAYWQRVAASGLDVRGKVFVDKMPLNTVALPLIAKFFPNAKIIFAIRDPRDVVLSCFRQGLRATAHVTDYSDLPQMADYYAAVMRLAALYRQRLALRLYDHKHESMIADFDGDTKKLCKFLEINWTDRMRDFVTTAKQRDIRTPSAQQVRQGLSSRGVGQWRRYGAAVSEIQQTLAPWVKAYGYE